MPNAQEKPRMGALWQPGVEDAPARTKPQVRTSEKTKPHGARYGISAALQALRTLLASIPRPTSGYVAEAARLQRNPHTTEPNG